jgi:hypothetical protein
MQDSFTGSRQPECDSILILNAAELGNAKDTSLGVADKSAQRICPARSLTTCTASTGKTDSKLAI